MKLVKIFVEGPADKKFLEDYISYILPDFKITEGTIEIVGGWERIYSGPIQNSIKRNTDEDGINLVIFDADTDFEERKSRLETWRDNNGLSFELFLLPNNQDVGTLEHLLENIILPQNQPIFDCWDRYEACLHSKGIAGRDIPLTLPAKKTKIYGYLEALLGNSKREKDKIKERKRDYKNVEHWNLDVEYLNPLKEFLLTCLSDD